MRRGAAFVVLSVFVFFTISLGQSHRAEAFEVLCTPYPGTSFVYDLSELEEEWREYFEKALERWQGLANVRLGTAPGDGSEIGVRVKAEQHREVEWAGLGRCGIERNPYIMFNTYRVKTEAQFMRVAVHEIGHTLGLLHSENLHSVMNKEYPFTSVPNEDDISGLRHIYGKPFKDADSGNDSPYPCEAPYPELRAGSEGSCVQYLQWILNKDREVPNKLLEDGRTNRTLMRIVKRHQFLNNISPRGVINAETWDSILEKEEEKVDRSYLYKKNDARLFRMLVWYLTRNPA